MGETERARDDGASLRLTAAALRLGEFTVRELSDSARANYETARDFVARRRNSGVLVPADETQSAAPSQNEDNPASGRPPQRYRISDNQRSATEKRLKAIRGSLASVTRAAADHTTDVEDEAEVGPLAILERAVRALSGANELSDVNRQARISDIEILRDAAERDVMALTTRGADAHRILRFGRRLGAATAHYEELKKQSQTLAVSGGAIASSGEPYGARDPVSFSSTSSEAPEAWRLLVDELVFACDGRWTGGVATARAINRFVILLDGIPQRQDPVTSRLLRDCVADALSVVAFEIGTFLPEDWDQLRNYLHQIQVVAPSVVTGMFVTLDGSTSKAWSMIKEVSRFDKIQGAYDFAPPGSHVSAVLRGADKHRGRIFCFDAVSEPGLGQRCEAVGINYVTGAADAG